MKFRPLQDRVAVRRIEEDQKSAGGIIIPDTAAEKPTQGEIVAVGSGVRNEKGDLIPLDVAEWDVKVRASAKLAATLAENLELALLFRHLATSAIDAPVSTTCAPPSPNTRRRIAHRRSTESSRPIMNRRKTTPSSASARTPFKSVITT